MIVLFGQMFTLVSLGKSNWHRLKPPHAAVMLTLDTDDSEFLCLRRLNWRRGFCPWPSAATPLLCWSPEASGCLPSPCAGASPGAAACWPSAGCSAEGRGRNGLREDVLVYSSEGLESSGKLFVVISSIFFPHQ